jgi:hypothetical protein
MLLFVVPFDGLFSLMPLAAPCWLQFASADYVGYRAVL